MNKNINNFFKIVHSTFKKSKYYCIFKVKFLYLDFKIFLGHKLEREKKKSLRRYEVMNEKQS